MNAPLLEVNASPFGPEQVDLLNRLLPTLTSDQMVWLSGYMAGWRGRAAVVNEGALPAPLVETAQAARSGKSALSQAREVLVLFGSQTGNAKRLAGELTRRLRDRGFAVTLCCMGDFRTANLKKARHLFVLVSTHGEGDPPDKAKLLVEYLRSKRASRLDGLQYSVLALGDLSYQQFCQTGKEFDKRLEELGARRLYPRADCDVDFEERAGDWMEGAIAALSQSGETLTAGPGAAGSAAPSGSACACNATTTHGSGVGAAAPSLLALSPFSATATVPSAAAPAYSRSRPFPAEVLENLNLNGRGSDKETRHVQISLEGSGLEHEPGDALGIYPQNHPALVDALIATMGWSTDEAVMAGKQEWPLREALLKHYEVTVLTRPLLEQASAFSRDGLASLVHESPPEKLQSYVRGRDLLDLVRDFSLDRVPARDFVGLLRKMPPRLYSIASSHRARPDEADLVIAAVRYQAHQRARHGTCSVYCAERLNVGDALPVFVQSNSNFRMPADPDTPLIMVGAGTGVAPFRAFLEDREESGASGKTWLVFGDRRFRTDFLYQVDWLRWLKLGILTRMDVAFSRDTDQKVYVQHRMLQHSREIFAWLEEGASFYVCGDASRMAPDVHAALEGIVRREGAMGPDEAQAYVARLEQQGRYQRDVY